MKNLRFLAIVILFILALSCSSDDVKTSGNLVGQWYRKEVKIGGKTFPALTYENCEREYLLFTPDNKGVLMSVEEGCKYFEDDFTYLKDGKKIAITMKDFLLNLRL